MVKLTKADWDKLVADDSAWDGVHYDEGLFLVNGVEVEEVEDDLPADTTIEIVDGVILHDDGGRPLGSLATHAKTMLARHKERRVAVVVPVGVSDEALNALLAGVGGRVER